MPTGDELRTVMRAFPFGVCVVTANVRGSRVGVTIGSLVSLSLDPPLVGISVGRDLALHELLRDAEAFGVSFLRGDQEFVAKHFARGVPPIALWEGVETREGELGPPLLAEALGWLECRIVAEHPAGDHTIFVGEVVTLELGDPGPALVYREAGYSAV